MVRCGYRTPEVQEREYLKDYANLKLEHPKWTKEKLDIEIEKRTSAVEVAPHCTGGAVDLSLADRDGSELKMGSAMGTFIAKSYSNSRLISKEERKNRKILFDAMTAAGFVNFPTEWWHWSYGDLDWAYIKNVESFYAEVRGRSSQVVMLGQPSQNLLNLSRGVFE
jgi:D-alanyl-D-alanine dipeptidase